MRRGRGTDAGHAEATGSPAAGGSDVRGSGLDVDVADVRSGGGRPNGTATGAAGTGTGTPSTGPTGTDTGPVAVSRLRRVVGLGAVGATLPYLTLKAIWVAGGTIGMNDPETFRTSTYLVANLLTFGLDGVLAAVALALTYRWGRRLPAPLVLFPMWMATGFLVTLALQLAVAIPLTAGTPAGDGDTDALAGWVFVLVYGGFVTQGLLIATAFVLYARDRWPTVLRRRVGEALPGHPRQVPVLIAWVGAGLAVLVAALGLAWGFGMTAGLPDFEERRMTIERATLGVYGVFALVAAVGALMLVHRRPAGAPGWLPLTLIWVGSGSMFAWGAYGLVLAAVNPDVTAPGVHLATETKVVAGVLLATVAAFLLQERSPGRRVPAADATVDAGQCPAVDGEATRP